MAEKDSDWRARVLRALYDTRHQIDWRPMPTADETLSSEETKILLNICRQLAEGGLIEWKSVAGGQFGMARITSQGIDVIEGNVASPIALTVDARRISVTGSANVQIGDGDNILHARDADITPGDFARLRESLEKLGIDSPAIEELRSAIDEQSGGASMSSLGGRVGEWIGKQVSRAANGAFALGVDQLTPALIEQIKSFFPQ
jgi:hypothetical protein